MATTLISQGSKQSTARKEGKSADLYQVQTPKRPESLGPELMKRPNTSCSTVSRAAQNVIKSKIAPDWKNVYRQFANAEHETHRAGIISKNAFTKALANSSAYLTKDEIEKLARTFSDSPDSVNYFEMSKKLGLHTNATELIRPTTA